MSTENVINNQRIAKNTFLLYLRTIFVLAVSLYTSRLVLKVLGVDDYGIYQVVGGMVTMFGILSNALSAAISRFITFELGSGKAERLKRLFSTSVVVQYVLAGIVFIIAEVVAIWFMETEMQLPKGREFAAKCVLHCSLFTFCVNLISIPYNACIIAHEHMKAFAYMSVVDVVLKLIACLGVMCIPIDKLISYSIFLAVISISIRILYWLYCKKHFEETRGSVAFDWCIFKEMLGFSGWSFLTNANGILNTQGVNMLINVFFGVTVNASRGISSQVESAVLQFVNNFTMAVNPQIIKSYAAGDIQGLYTLICRGAKFAYFAMFIMVLPLVCETPYMLSVWLTIVPPHTVIFVQLSLILGIFDCIGFSSYTACMATGRIRLYSITLAIIGALEFPLTWIFFTYGAPVVSTYYLYIFVKILVLIARVILLRDMVGLPPQMYIIEVLIPILLTTLIAIIPSLLIISFFPSSFVRLCISVIVAIISVGLSALYIGMTQREREEILEKVNSVVNRLKK